MLRAWSPCAVGNDERPVRRKQAERRGRKRFPAGRQIEAAQTAATAVAPSNSLRAFRQSLQDAAVHRRPIPTSRWVDGSEPIDDDDSDEDSEYGDRKLSKSDRKRLRKLKAQDRAA